ncbi:MAG: hypothetical protein KC912_08875 [Proteobacteria bacterium]|nr:hypothetical protein [Pseudomonadota bacterium]
MRTVLLAALVAGCSPTTLIDTTDAPTTGSRHRMPWVEFNVWTDFLSLEVGLSDSCTFLEPIVDNHSVSNPPIQAFWVIYQNESDVVDGSQVEDTFWLGDSFANHDYPEIDGLDALGFKFPPPIQQSFLSIEEIVLSEDRRQADAVLGNPLDVRLRMVTDEIDGICTITHTYCAMPCDEPNAELDHIEVELGFLNTVQNVTFIEP